MVPFGQPPVGCVAVGALPELTANASSGPELNSRETRRAPDGLAAEAELLDERPIAVHVVPVEVVQQAPALAHEHQQAAARVVVLLVLAQVLGELVDAGREQRDLDLGRPGVALVGRVLGISSLLASLVRVTAEEGSSFTAARALATASRVCSTSSFICSTSSSAESKRSSSRSRSRKASRSVSPVEVPVEVDQVGLDPQSPSLLERRPHADADGGRDIACRPRTRARAPHRSRPRAPPRPARVDVGRRHAQLAPARVARARPALEPVGRAEQLGRRAHVARGDQLPDPARGDGLAVVLDQRHHLGLELRPRPQQVGVAARPWPKRKFAPTLTLPAPSAPASTSSQKSSARASRELGGERDRDHLVDPELGHQVRLRVGGGQQLRRVARGAAPGAGAGRTSRPPSRSPCPRARSTAVGSPAGGRGARRRRCPARPSALPEPGGLPRATCRRS